MNTPSHQARGFTLVEIMIVVAIVGLLSAMAVPSMMHVRKRSQDTVVLNAIRQLYDAKELYFTDEGAGKSWVNLARLEKSGYASQSLVATCKHDFGGWRTTALAGFLLKPGEPIKLTETITSSRATGFRRSFVYPSEP